MHSKIEFDAIKINYFCSTKN